jgi:adenine phosphoribosyltransferase
MNLKSLIRTVPDFPSPGIRFRDITPLLAHPPAMRHVTKELAKRFEGQVDKVAAIEARGFLFGATVAQAIGAGLIPVRKPGKLPFSTIGHDYALEYGTNRVELHVDAVSRGDRVLVVDDLLATGGTARAALGLLDRLGATVIGCAFVIELADLGGRARIEGHGHDVHALCSYVETE